MTLRYYPILSIAGSDSSGGAGIQADIKSIAANGCYAMTAITAVTAQNTRGVDRFEAVTPALVEAQIVAVAADIPPLAVKSGMLANAAVIEAVAGCITRFNMPNYVLDPVMVSTSGCALIDDAAIEAMKRLLFGQALLVTPNAKEAAALTGIEGDPQRQARELKGMGCRNVLLKGGDADNEPTATDYLMMEGTDTLIPLRADRVATANTHGTGCSLSAAIASRLALGDDLLTAVRRAKLYVTRALAAGADISIGSGHGPMNHFFQPKRQKIYESYD